MNETRREGALGNLRFSHDPISAIEHQDNEMLLSHPAHPLNEVAMDIFRAADSVASFQGSSCQAAPNFDGSRQRSQLGRPYSRKEAKARRRTTRQSLQPTTLGEKRLRDFQG
jgi:hypothetical protein